MSTAHTTVDPVQRTRAFARVIGPFAFPQLMLKGMDASVPGVGPVHVVFLFMALAGLYLTYVGWIKKPAIGD
ncbi:hypothetical protein HNP40_000638 [Mycobacteroides chelonae]|nr:hypothetical protein [Mycobacteroides chelonae]